MSVAVDAERQRVWRALTRAEEVVAWSPVRVAALDVPPDHPRPGGRARWRYRLGRVTVNMTEEALEVTPCERLRSSVGLALLAFEQTWTLAGETGDPKRTRVALKLVVPNAVPVVGGLLDRFGVRGFAQSLVDRSLRALRAWCEGEGAPRCAGPRSPSARDPRSARG